MIYPIPHGRNTCGKWTAGSSYTESFARLRSPPPANALPGAATESTPPRICDQPAEPTAGARGGGESPRKRCQIQAASRDRLEQWFFRYLACGVSMRLPRFFLEGLCMKNCGTRTT